MNEIGTLFLLELRSLYGLNIMRHVKDPKAKHRYHLLTVAWMIVIAVICIYVAGLVVALAALNLQGLIPSYLTILATLLVLIFGLFTAGHRLFPKKGYDILSAMPLRPRSIVISRFAVMYLEDVLLTLAIFLPGGITYAIGQTPSPFFYLTALAGVLLIPVMPLLLSVILGTVILAISARAKHKSLIQTVLMVALVLIILLGSFLLQDDSNGFSSEIIAERLTDLATFFETWYPPVAWLGDAMAVNNFGGIFWLLLLSCLLMAGSMFLITRTFAPVMRRLFRVTAKHRYTITRMESRGLLRALYTREMRRYFSSGIYVTNTIIGPILGAIMSVALCVIGVDTIASAMPAAVPLYDVLPPVISAVFCMMTATSTAISMEGRSFWVIRSLPIPTKTWLDSKILLNLSLMMPFYLVSEICLLIALRPNLWDALWIFFCPLILILFSVVCGITINLRFHSFTWEKEEQIVKQSFSSMLGGFVGMFLSIPLVGILLVTPSPYALYAKIGLGAAIAFATLLLYRKNITARLETL